MAAQASTRILFIHLILATLLVAIGCEAPKPAKMEIRPEGPIVFKGAGATTQVKVMGFDDKGKPFTSVLKPTWESSAPNVAEVAADGKVTAMGEGTATLTANVSGVKATKEVQVFIPASIELHPKSPKAFAKDTEPYRLNYRIKNKTGKTIKGVVPAFSVKGSCAEVIPPGIVKVKALGTCDIDIKLGAVQTRHTIEVKAELTKEEEEAFQPLATDAEFQEEFDAEAVKKAEEEAAKEAAEMAAEKKEAP
jgi:hypothetical protein